MWFADEDIISASKFDRPSMQRLFTLARRMAPIERREVECNVLRKYTLGNFFWEESTRTRLSSERAFKLLGGDVCTMTDMKFSSEVKGESLTDSAIVLSKFCDIMVVRCRHQGEARKIARYSRVPVINGGDGKGEHPTQGLLEVFTIDERTGGQIDNSSITLVGDLRHSRSVHSLVKLLTFHDNLNFDCVATPEFQIPSSLEALIHRRGHTYKKQPTSVLRCDVRMWST